MNNTRLPRDELPAAKAVELSANTRYKCQAWEPLANGGKGEYIPLSVNVKSYGPEFAPKPRKPR